MKMVYIFGYMISVMELNNLVENGTIDEIDIPEEAREALEEYRIDCNRREYAMAWESYVREA